jgi:ABC-type dipeptide/oligopeptide/nickel transport system permease component
VGGFLMRRLATNALVFFVITIAIFGLVHSAPGDPIAMQIPADQLNTGSAQFIVQRRAELGLDRPVYVQYWHWLSNAVSGDLGYSLRDGRPVTELLVERIGPTLELMVVGLLISLLVAIPLGILAARRRNSILDYGTAVVSLGSVSIPIFFLALTAIYLFTLKLQWLPSSGISDPTNPGVLDSVRHLILPAVILGLGNCGVYLRYVRSSMITELDADYVRTAEAKGAGPRRVVVRHALRNSLIPVLTVIASNLGQLVAGAVVIEQVFAWPGMGQLAVSSVTQHDYSVIIGFALLIAIIVLMSNLLADVLYTISDPRVRLR